jgi:hypothetical protein
MHADRLIWRHIVKSLIAPVAILVGAPALLVTAQLADTASVSGSVTTEGMTVSEAQVKFEGADTTTATTGVEGNYSVSLAPGVYKPSVRYRVFCNEKRAPIVVPAEARVTLNFHPWVCPSESGWDYNEEVLHKVPNSPLEADIVYGKSQLDGDHRTFTGVVMLSPYPVVVTFDFIELEATRVDYYPKRNSVVATGQVHIDNNGNQSVAKKLEIVFAAQGAVVTIIEK